MALLQSYQEYIKLVTHTAEDHVADWEEGNHILEESEAEIQRLSNVRRGGDVCERGGQWAFGWLVEVDMSRPRRQVGPGQTSVHTWSTHEI